MLKDGIMKKRGPLVAMGMAVALMLALAGVSLASHEGAWPPIKVDLSIQQDGNLFTTVVWVRNEGHFDSDVLNVRGQVPRGAQYVRSWAGSGPGFNAGVFDGNDVGWVNTSGVKAGGQQGPFVYVFDASSLSSVARPSVSAWASWVGKVPGTSLSKVVRIQPLLPAVDASLGTPPSAGWKWAVAELTAGTDEVSDGPHAHDYSWVFFVVKGSSEISTADVKAVLSSGQGIFIPARQQHAHRYLPQSRVVAFHLRPADDPPVALHRGRTLLVSDAPIGVSAGVNYQLRVRQFSLSPGERTPESVTVEPNFGYVVEGTLTTRVGDGVSSAEAGKAFTMPLNVRHVESNEGSTPLRFILVDVRSTANVVVEALRRGGYVILLRHGQTDRMLIPPALRTPEPSPLDLANCEVQPKLTEKGRDEVRAVGAGFQRLGIPVGQVLTSGYCHILETARLAFGRAEVLGALLHPGYVPLPGAPVPPSAEERMGALRQLLAIPPPPGTNTILSTHSENVRPALGFELATGEAAVFKSDGRGGFTLLARILPNEWGASP